MPAKMESRVRRKCLPPLGMNKIKRGPAPTIHEGAAMGAGTHGSGTTEAASATGAALGHRLILQTCLPREFCRVSQPHADVSYATAPQFCKNKKSAVSMAD